MGSVFCSFLNIVSLIIQNKYYCFLSVKNLIFWKDCWRTPLIIFWVHDFYQLIERHSTEKSGGFSSHLNLDSPKVPKMPLVLIVLVFRTKFFPRATTWIPISDLNWHLLTCTAAFSTKLREIDRWTGDFIGQLKKLLSVLTFIDFQTQNTPKLLSRFGLTM